MPIIADRGKSDLPQYVHTTFAWVIDQCPELETVLRAEVLDPRGSTFPRSTDLALRMPKPQKWVEF
jgi:hypothetical protein